MDAAAPAPIRTFFSKLFLRGRVKPPMKSAFAAAMVLLALALPSHAVIISGGDGTGNTTGSGVTGWDYVGGIYKPNSQINASGTYLGNYNGSYYIITAYHVALSGLGSFILGDYTYSFVTGTGVQIKDDATDTKPADLYVIQITGSEVALAALDSMANLNLAESTPSTGTNVTMIGYGRDRSTTAGTAYVKSSQWYNTAPAQPYDTVNYYNWLSTNSKRWGTNQVSSFANAENGYGTTALVSTTFSSSAGNNEAQAAEGDSGGGVFYSSGSDTVLSGIMVYVGRYNGQPTESAAYGNATYYADISKYRENILAAVPEPSSVSLLLISAVGLFSASRLRFRKPGQ
jgi:hypothetical protein